MIKAEVEYQRRLEVCQTTILDRARDDSRLANLRLVLFLVGLGVALAAFLLVWIHAAWLALPIVAFIAIAVVHDRVLREKRTAQILSDFYAAGLRRIHGEWMGTGLSGEEFVPPDHPYAHDLDLLGQGSLYELLCTARTRTGQQVLAEWLCARSGVDQVSQRQEAVRELQDNLDLREALAIAGSELQAKVHPESLACWAALPEAFPPSKAHALFYLLPAAAILSLLAWALLGTPAPLLLVFVLNLVLLKTYGVNLKTLTQSVEEPGRELAVLGGVLARFEKERFQCAYLNGLQDRLAAQGQKASQQIVRLNKLVYYLELPGNMLFAPIAILLLWPIHVGRAIDRWRAQWGHNVAAWLRATGELEAVCCVAGYACEHPADVFPTVCEGPPHLVATALGHPLLAEKACIRNDVRLDRETRVLLVSGSNMSGKSTLLRTVGISAVLAMLGAPVRAASLELNPMSIGATMRIHDSIQEGRSRFYAEIRRIKEMLDLAQSQPPLLFLMDEILHGTNSHDREIGASAIINGFLERGAIGLLSTHDLALTRMPDALGGTLRNVHFQDTFDGEELHFDYRIHDGVVQHSNALALMRGVGIEV